MKFLHTLAKYTYYSVMVAFYVYAAYFTIFEGIPQMLLGY